MSNTKQETEFEFVELVSYRSSYKIMQMPHDKKLMLFNEENNLYVTLFEMIYCDPLNPSYHNLCLRKGNGDMVFIHCYENGWGNQTIMFIMHQILPKMQIDLVKFINKCKFVNNEIRSSFMTRIMSINIHQKMSQVECDIAQNNRMYITEKIFELLKLHQPMHKKSYSTKRKAANKHTRYSKAAMEWLNHIMHTQKIHIEHALNGGEHTIMNSKYKADGYCRNTNTIYEFHGCFFHGCPFCYDGDHTNAKSKKKFGVLYNNTITRGNFIKEMGYNLVVTWGHNWTRYKKHQSPILSSYGACEMIYDHLWICGENENILSFFREKNIDIAGINNLNMYKYCGEVEKMIKYIFNDVKAGNHILSLMFRTGRLPCHSGIV